MEQLENEARLRAKWDKAFETGKLQAEAEVDKWEAESPGTRHKRLNAQKKQAMEYAAKQQKQKEKEEEQRRREHQEAILEMFGEVDPDEVDPDIPNLTTDLAPTDLVTPTTTPKSYENSTPPNLNFDSVSTISDSVKKRRKKKKKRMSPISDTVSPSSTSARVPIWVVLSSKKKRRKKKKKRKSNMSTVEVDPAPVKTRWTWCGIFVVMMMAALLVILVAVLLN